MNIQDYLHLYLGCDVIHKDGTTAKLVSTTTMGECAFIHNDTNQFGVSSPEEFGKLILRPISDVTPEEAEEMWYMIEPKNVLEMQGHRQTYKVALCSERTRYLLSKGFDLFGLIDAGLAISKANHLLTNK
jgi:hypothetical protein